MSKITINQAINLSDEEILLHLHQEWNILDTTAIEVMGIISASYNADLDKYFYHINHIKFSNGFEPEYPLTDLRDRETIKESGIFVPSGFTASKAIKQYINAGGTVKVKCELVLARQEERLKHDNPFLLEVAPKTLQILDEIKESEIIRAEDGGILIPDSIVQYYLEKNKKKTEELIKNINEEYKKTKDNLEEELTKKQNDLQSIQEEYTQQVENNTNKQAEYEEFVVQIQQEIENKTAIENQIKELKIDLERKEELMSEKLEKLRSFIKDKADTLLDLEFIDKSEYNNLLMIKEESEDDEKFVDFSEDLHGNKQKAISHIQAYLFEHDIVYPRYILEDFFALIQTNDLIILAGESGSGKTNLIKSFAKAIGGESRIIPVKPNWTSSEDLLGYYNPLEKKYLSTPFLEALLEAKDNPDIPYFICLDEMNLARIEYYFADFLSLLEERGEQPEIKLYSEDESSHILSEFKNVMDTIEYTKEKYKKKNIVNFVKLLQDEEINRELTRIFGFSDKDSLIKYHTDLRRMLSGILNTPSSIVFPKNVRIIGAINIDETTHYLSPKILDRAHIMKFDSPLLQDWDAIAAEIEDIENKELKIKINIEDLGTREPYPSFDREDDFCKAITSMTKEYFSPLGVEVGLRTIRQGLNYQKIFIEQGSDKELVMNNFIIHKILPKMTFDGNKQVGDKKEDNKGKLLLQFKENLKEYIDQDLAKSKSIDAIDELEEIIKISESNEKIVNYWA